MIPGTLVEFVKLKVIPRPGLKLSFLQLSKERHKLNLLELRPSKWIKGNPFGLGIVMEFIPKAKILMITQQPDDSDCMIVFWTTLNKQYLMFEDEIKKVEKI